MDEGPQKADLKERLERARQAQNKAQQKNAERAGTAAHSASNSNPRSKRGKNESQGQDTPQASKKSSSDVKLPRWPHDQYSTPVAILRSALFGVIKPGRRQQLKDQELAAWPGVTIRYTGERLDQADLDVFDEALQHYQYTDYCLGDAVEISSKAFLRSIGRNTGKKDREWLRSSFLRMVASAVQIKVGEVEYVGSLIHAFTYNDKTGRFHLKINPEFAKLFQNGHTRIDKQKRLALGNRQLAKAVYGFIQTHKADKNSPLKVSYSRMYQLFGQHYNRKRNFYGQLRQTLQDLQNWEYITSWKDKGKNLEIIK